MTEVTYDVAIDMSDSTAFAQGFADTEEGIIYLVFKNGSHVSRKMDPAVLKWAIECDENSSYWSWGAYWHNVLKEYDLGPDVSDGATFVQRDDTDESAPDTIYDVASDGERYSHRLALALIDELDDRFSMDVEDYTDFDDFAAAVQYVLAHTPADEQTDAQSEDEVPEPQANRSDATGTFVGLGYLGVSDEERAHLTGLLGATQDFIGKLLPNVSPLLEVYNVDDVRSLFGRFL